MRLFVAIDIPSAVKDALEQAVACALHPSLAHMRWTRPEGRHLTVKFLGEVSETLLDDVDAAIAHACSAHAPFTAAFDRVGGFPNLRRPRVVWVGVGQGAEAMTALAVDVDRSLAGVGFATESRGFTAHLTLARARDPRVVEALPEVTVPSEPFGVSELVLFRSQLLPQGARYTPLQRYPLDT